MKRTASSTAGYILDRSAVSNYFAVHPVGPVLSNVFGSLLFWTLTGCAICRVYSIVAHMR